MNHNYIMRAVGGSLLLLAPCLSVYAAPLTPEQALQRAEASSAVRQMPGKASFSLSYTEKSEGDDVLFIFNRGNNGFIVASADDRMPALLGYSDNGAFDFATASPELKWWLEQYATEAGEYFHNSMAPQQVLNAAPRAERAPIGEMLETRWDQNFPYNLDCPEDAYGKCVTGCVATAMAQVIKYHNYPVTGKGSHSYNWNGRTLGFDYGTTEFDYDNMLPVYDINTDYVQQKAVAQLMYACGVGVNMNYTSGESGASDMYIPYALKEFFNYDAGARLLKREYYPTDAWEDIIYSELAAGRPVIYSGQAPDGGHAFVCDGYENDYYHINWGWSGGGNGWFLLSALDPGLEGIGGFAGGYNSSQVAICGVQPPAGDTAAWYPIYSTGGLDAEPANRTAIYINIGNNGGVLNYSPEPVTVSFYLKAVSESGDEYLSPNGYELNFRGAQGTSVGGYNSFPVYLPTDVPAGSYKAYVVFQTPEGNWQNLPVPLTMSGYLDMNVDTNGNMTFAPGIPVEHPRIRVIDFWPEEAVVSGEPARFYLTIVNTGEVEYKGPFFMSVFTHGTSEQLVSTGINITIAPGEVFNGYVDITYNLPDGRYDLIFYNMYYEQISELFPLWIGVLPTEITLSQTTASMEAESTLQLTATVMPEDAADKTVIWTSSDPEIANVDSDGLVTAFSVGEVTITATSQAVESVYGTCVITVTPKIIEAAAVTLDVTDVELTEGDTLTLTATIEPDDTTDKTLTWVSSAPEIAEVNNGIVTAIAPGTTVITVTTANGLTAACAVTVKARPIEAAAVTLDVTDVELTEGDTLTLTATIEPDDTTDKTLTWSSSAPEVADVNNGIVTANAPGTAIITVTTANGLTATCTVTVNALIIEATAITLDVTEAELTVDDTLTLTATIEPENTTDKTLKWSSSAPEVADVDNGVVKANAPGTAVITVTTANGLKATCTVTVNARIIYATSITLDRESIEGEVGTTVTLTATVLPDDTTDKTVAWSSSDESIATVDAAGNVTIISTGFAVITATTTDGSDLTATCTVTGMSGIEALVREAGTADVYSINGFLIRKNADISFISNLTKGTYLISIGGKTVKIVK